MSNDNVRSKLFARRALVLSGFKISLMLSLMARLYYLQIIKESEYKTRSDSNRIRLSIIPPLRGIITDAYGLEIAKNQNYYRVLFDPGEASNMNATLTRVANILGLTYEETQSFLQRTKHKHKKSGSILLYDHLTWEQVARIEVNAPDLPGIFIDVAQIRYYPYGETVSHVLGYVDTVSKEEYDRDNPLLSHPDFKIGKNGIEKSQENSLRGIAGVKRMEVNAYGGAVRELSREESKPGERLPLTLDIALQDFAHKRLDSRGASAVVMDIHTGYVLALCSTPGYDPNQFAYGISPKYWGELVNNQYKPLVNKAIARQYPPGSTFKMLVALSALKEGVDPNKQVYCPGYFTLGRRRFHCWREEGHGSLNMQDAIAHSCNVFFFTMAQRIGIDNIEAIAKKFGLGSTTGIEIPNEVPGIVPGREWKEKKYNQEWQKGDTLNAGIGQGFTNVTTLQLATVAARLASGKAVFPRLIPFAPDTKINYESLSIPEAHRRLVLDGMIDVVNKPGRTAYGSRITEAGYSMAGKTGTSQVVAKSVNADKEENEIAWKNRNHALFIGFAPVENPRYSIAVIVEHGASGSRAAAPAARDILWELQKMETARKNPTPVIPPTTTEEKAP